MSTLIRYILLSTLKIFSMFHFPSVILIWDVKNAENKNEMNQKYVTTIYML